MKPPTDPRYPLLHHKRRRDSAWADAVPAVLLASSLLLPLVVMILVLPPPVVLPAFSLWALGAAAVVGLAALIRGGTTAWDLAGAFTLIGCAAAILGEVEHMLDFFRPLPSRSEAND